MGKQNKRENGTEEPARNGIDMTKQAFQKGHDQN